VERRREERSWNPGPLWRVAGCGLNGFGKQREINRREGKGRLVEGYWTARMR